MSRISIATTVKAAPATIRQHVDYHLGIGVRSLHLFLDDPPPEDVEYLRQRYPRQVTLHVCDTDYWRDVHGIDRPESVEARQRTNADHALTLARRAGDEWIAHLDIDEYVWTAGDSLPQLLAAVPRDCNVLRMDVLEAIPAELEIRDLSTIRHFKSLPFDLEPGDAQYEPAERLRRALVLTSAKVALNLAHAAGISAARHGFHNFYNAHTMGKCFTRVSDAVRSLRLHFPWFQPGTPVRVHATRRIRMMHFESCSFSDWVSKWQRRSSREGFAAALDRRQQVIFGQFAACAGDARKLEALYRNLYFYSAAELGLLRFMGLVESIDPTERFPAQPA